MRGNLWGECEVGDGWRGRSSGCRLLLLSSPEGVEESKRLEDCWRVKDVASCNVDAKGHETDQQWQRHEHHDNGGANKVVSEWAARQQGVSWVLLQEPCVTATTTHLSNRLVSVRRVLKIRPMNDSSQAVWKRAGQSQGTRRASRV